MYDFPLTLRSVSGGLLLVEYLSGPLTELSNILSTYSVFFFLKVGRALKLI